MSSRYPIPAGRARVEDEVKHSRFIATLEHAATTEEARAFLEEMRAEFPDATHNCWAYVAGPPGSPGETGAGDDGEPGGTAGRPMLAVLLGSEVGEIVAVVTRYFGGVKLGRGGLVRAYSGVVRRALREMTFAEHVTRVRLRIELPYAAVGAVQRTYERFGVMVEEEFFAEIATLVVSVPETELDPFQRAVRDATAGGAVVSRNWPD